MSETAVLGLLGLAVIAVLVAFSRRKGRKRTQSSNMTESREDARADGALLQTGPAIRAAIVSPSEAARRNHSDEDAPNVPEPVDEGPDRTSRFESAKRTGSEGGEARKDSPEVRSVNVTRELHDAAAITGLERSGEVAARVEGSSIHLGGPTGKADEEVEPAGSQDRQSGPLVDADDTVTQLPDSGSATGPEQPTAQGQPGRTYAQSSETVPGPDASSADAKVSASQSDGLHTALAMSSERRGGAADDLRVEAGGRASGLMAERPVARCERALQGDITSTDASEFAGDVAHTQPSHDAADQANEPTVAREMPPTEGTEETPRQRRYRVAPRNPVVARPATRRETASTLARGSKVDVRLLFRRSGTCTVSLVPRRSNSMPVHVAVSRGRQSFDLVEMQDGWYEDVFPDDIGAQLAAGVAWQGRADDGQVFRWALGGRDVFVLAPHEELGGYVDTNRLLLNQEHAILCTEQAENSVQLALQECGGPAKQRFGASEGAPAGWVVLKGVVPHRRVSSTTDTDPLDCLRPASGAQVVLEGGVRVQANVWLRGYPPIIRVNGDEEEVHQLFIDGRPATKGPDGGFAAQGWDTAGSHFIASTAGNISYSILETDQNWPTWPAHRWSLGEDEMTAAITSRPAICGALVMPPAERASAKRAVVVPVTNVLLLGAAPGQVEICSLLADRTSREVVGFPSFEPVWALPLDPMHCDRKLSAIILLSATPPNGATVARMSKQSKAAIRAWCAAVLGASRKRLTTAPGDETTRDLWNSYRTAARLLHRRVR